MIDDRRHISSNPFTLKTILWKMDKFDFYIFSGSDLKCIVSLSCPFMLQYNYEKEESFCQVEIYWDSLFARSRSPFQVLARQADEGGGWPFKTHISNSTSALFRLFDLFEAAQGGEKLLPSLPTMPEGFVHISYFSSAAVAIVNSST